MKKREFQKKAAAALLGKLADVVMELEENPNITITSEYHSSYFKLRKNYNLIQISVKQTPVSAADAKAGDIIFFTGTYNSGVPVSHVGIYCGNGVMIHCGDPISYASINSSYWQSHFYAFGRLSGN